MIGHVDSNSLLSVVWILYPESTSNENTQISFGVWNEVENSMDTQAGVNIFSNFSRKAKVDPEPPSRFKFFSYLWWYWEALLDLSSQHKSCRALEGTCNFTRSSARSLASLFSAMSVFGVLRWSRKFWDHLDGANFFPSIFRKARAVPRVLCGSGNPKSPLWAFQASTGIFWVLWGNSVNFSIGSS